MPKAKIHPHPTHPYRCEDCKFWHPNYQQNLAMNQQGQVILVSQALQQGVNVSTWLTFTASKCFYNPQWVDTKADEYCSHFSANKVY
jgi:hypothetical protein